MDEKITYWASVAFGAVSLLLLVITIFLINSNRHMNDEINMRGAAIQRGAQLSQTNQALIQALAEIVVKDNNSAIKDLLGKQGITLRPKADTAPVANTSPKSPDTKKTK